MPTVVKAYIGSTPLFTTTSATSGWTRNTEWLTLPSASSDEVRGLHAVFDHDENYCSVNMRTTDGSTYTIDWGDGNVETCTSNVQTIHDYYFANAALDGTLTSKGYKQALVRIYPQAGKTFYRCNLSEKASTPSGLQAYTSGWLDLNFNLPNLNSGQNLLISGTTIRHGYLERVNITSWGSITNIDALFRNCSVLESINSNEFNMANITVAASMFFGCYKLGELDCSSWDLRKCTNLANFVRDCRALERISCSTWNLSACTSLDAAFFTCDALSDLDVSNWDTRNLANLSYTFGSCFSLKTLNLSGWDTRKVTALTNTFNSCFTLQTIDISNWQLPICTAATDAFFQCYNLQKLETCNLSAVTSPNFGTNFASTCNSLKKVTLQGIAQSINFTNCSMSSTSLNTLYTNLATVGAPGSNAKIITVTNNYGTASDDPTIAQNKGWTVTG